MGRVVVVHPDLGVGGAERLIVDASKALQDCGHNVRIYTGYHEKSRCFEETKDGTLITHVVGSWIPRSIFGKCYALMAYLKMIYIALYLLLFTQYDLVLCDQVSACLPIFRLNLRRRTKIVFYCHFPDQLLTRRDSLIKSFYRKPLDYYEELSMRAADIILVNSKFTSLIVRRTFNSLKDRELIALYPCVDVKKFVELGNDKTLIWHYDQYISNLKLPDHEFCFLSINRFERKKNLELAIHALSECIMGFEETSNGQAMKVVLILVGGYDQRLLDNVQYYLELERLVDDLNLNNYVKFIKSPSDMDKIALLQMSDAIIYTPKNEHFGIVPLEAMAMSKPVIASASGGPLETVEMDVTGILCEHDKYSFADAMLRLYTDRRLSIELGMSGYRRVIQEFSFEAFRDKLNNICFSPLESLDVL